MIDLRYDDILVLWSKTFVPDYDYGKRIQNHVLRLHEKIVMAVQMVWSDIENRTDLRSNGL